MQDNLHAGLEAANELWPDRIAVDEPGGPRITYRELSALTDRLRDRLWHLGIRPGDRVGIYCRKSVAGVAGVFGTLKCGAAYVPVDPESPAPRCAYILNDCTVGAVLTETRLAAPLRAELAKLGPVPPLLLFDDGPSDVAIKQMLDGADRTSPAKPVATVRSGADDLAYVLYTSGSTGRPKGVMLTHRCATSYVNWCSQAFAPTEHDVFSSHAPFHFDLSILDIYVPLKHGARLILIDESLGKEPQRLAQVIAEKKISVWYSVPSILNLLAEYGRLAQFDYSALRLVLFAGEVFPIPQLRAISTAWPHPRYFNLYGPTETNVCTYYEVPLPIPPDRVEPFPIGYTCSHVETRVVDLDGNDVSRGEQGELVVSGAGVMIGYWNLPDQNAAAFLEDECGRRWYRTGDLVVETPSDGYVFHGRRDRMVKRRGYRIELGEIETGLSTHPSIKEVAVVALPDLNAGVRIKAWLSTYDGQKLSLIDLKQYSVNHLPRYMVPDLFAFVPALPRTSTNKIDYQTLKQQG